MTDTEKVEKLAKIAGRLLELTGAGKIDWEDTHDEHTFTTSLEKYSFSVYHYASRCVLTVVNDRGNVIERFEPAEGDPDYGTLTGLYESARQQALRVEESLDEIIQTLG